jgi:hypothetical protein
MRLEELPIGAGATPALAAVAMPNTMAVLNRVVLIMEISFPVVSPPVDAVPVRTCEAIKTSPVMNSA